MSDRMLELAARRNALRAHCEIQRSFMTDTARDIQERLAGIDRTVAIVKHYAHKPVLAIGVVGLIAMLGPKRLLRWASQGAFLYTTGRRLLRMVRR